MSAVVSGGNRPRPATRRSLGEDRAGYADSGSLDTGIYTRRLEDSYYQAPPKVSWLYEFVNSYWVWQQWQGNPYLYRTNVGDGDPAVLCGEGGGYVEHPIAKDGRNGIVSDSFYPNKYVPRLSPTTYHTSIWWWWGATNVCNYYRPYTH